MKLENLKIKHETDKAYLLEKEGVKFWIAKSWVFADGTLNKMAFKVFNEAKKNDEKVRKEAEEKPRAKELNIAPLLEKGRSIASEKESLDAMQTKWLKELTRLVSLLFAHTKKRDANNQIYAVDVWDHIQKALQTENINLKT